MTVVPLSLRAVGPLLSELGFRKRAGEVFTVELAEGVLGWLGLNRATRHRPAAEIEINPVVGVRHQGVERLVAELRGEQFHPYQPPTVSTPLGYLLAEGHYRPWVFREGSSDDTAKDMTAAIGTHGLRFMRSTTSLAELCRRLEEGLGFEHQLLYRRPVAWLLAGDPRRTVEALDESLAKIAGRTDIAAGELRRFSEVIRRKIGRVP